MKGRRGLENFFIVELLLLLIYAWIVADKTIYLGTLVFNTICIVGAGFKFDLLSGQSDSYFFKSFKIPLLNTVNLVIQTIAYTNTVFFILPLLESLGKLSFVTNSHGQLTVLGFLLALAIGLVFTIPFLFTKKITASKNLLVTLLNTLAVLFIYFIFITPFLDSVIETIGKPFYFLEQTPLYPLFLVFIPWVLYLLKSLGFALPSFTINMDKRTLKVYSSVLLFIIVMFYFDSAVWYHPIHTWKFTIEALRSSINTGVGEEFLMRFLFFPLFVFATKKYRHGTLLAISMQALLFGSFHLINYFSNPEAVLSSVLVSTIDATGIGFLFACLYLVTKSGWPSVLFHVFWNFFQISITGETNISLTGVEGMVVAIFVGIMFTIAGLVLLKKYQPIIEDNTRALIHNQDVQRTPLN